MWKIMTVRINYYTTEEILVWSKHPWDLNAACKLMELMGIQASCFHDYIPDEEVAQ